MRISNVFEDIFDCNGDIKIPHLENVLSEDAEVAGTQKALRASSQSLVPARLSGSTFWLDQIPRPSNSQQFLQPNPSSSLLNCARI